MGKVSYTFSCGWSEPTLSTGDILWIKHNCEWRPFKIKEILIEYDKKYYDSLSSCDYKSFNSHAIFRCVAVMFDTDNKFEAEEDSCETALFINVDEKEIGMTVFSRHPDEPLEDYYKRTNKNNKAITN